VEEVRKEKRETRQFGQTKKVQVNEEKNVKENKLAYS